MGQLTNQFVSSSYQGLLNLENANTGVTATLQYVTDGVGNKLPMLASTSSIVITGSFRGDGSGLSGLTIDSGSLVTTASFNAFTSSIDNRVDNLEQETGSLQLQINQKLDTGSFNAYTSSNDTKVNSLIAATGSYATTSSLTTLSGSIATTDLAQDNRLTSIEGITGSLATTSSLTSLSSSIATTDLAQNNRLNSIETTTGSLQLQINEKLNTGSFNAYTSSNDTKVNDLISKTGSYVTETESGSFVTSVTGVSDTITVTKGDGTTNNVTVNNVNNSVSSSYSNYAVTASFALNAPTIDSGSFATTGSNVFKGNQTITGSVQMTDLSNNTTLAVTGSIIFSNLLKGNTIENNTNNSIQITNNNGVNSEIGLTPGVGANLKDVVVYANNANRGLVVSGSANITNAVTASYFVGDGSNLTNIVSSSFAQNSISSSQAQNAVTASFALNAPSINTGSFLTQAYITGGTTNLSLITTQGDGLVLVSNVQTVPSASYALTAVSSSQAQNAVSASWAPMPDVSYFATTGSNTFTGLQQINNDLIISGNLYVSGTEVIVSSSTLIIGDREIELNANRTVGNAGIIVYDVITPEGTGSMQWDATNNYWIAGFYGSETKVITAADTGSLSVANAVSSSFATNAISSSQAQNAVSSSHSINSDTAISSSFAQNAISSSYATNAGTAVSSSFATNADTAVSSSYAQNADNAVSSSFATNAISSSFAQTAVSASWAPMPDVSYFATTGSNTFIGNQIISGSVDITGSVNVQTALTASGLNYPTADGVGDMFLSTDGGGNLTFDWVKTLHQNVRNSDSVTISRGTPLFVSGATGDNVNVYVADANNPSRRPATLIAFDSTLAPSATGTAIISGEIQGVDTTGYPAGSVIYLASGGGWTSTRPTGSASVQVLGVVTREANNGRGIVFNQVADGLPNIQEGYLWVGDSNSYPDPVATSSLSVASSVSSSYSDYAVSSSQAQNAVSSSHSVNSDTAISSSFAQTSISSSQAQNAVSSSYSDFAVSSSLAQNSITSSFSDFAVSSSQAENAVSASWAPTPDVSYFATTGSNNFFGTENITGSLIVTGSATFREGNMFFDLPHGTNGFNYVTASNTGNSNLIFSAQNAATTVSQSLEISGSNNFIFGRPSVNQPQYLNRIPSGSYANFVLLTPAMSTSSLAPIPIYRGNINLGTQQDRYLYSTSSAPGVIPSITNNYIGGTLQLNTFLQYRPMSVTNNNIVGTLTVSTTNAASYTTGNTSTPQVASNIVAGALLVTNSGTGSYTTISNNNINSTQVQVNNAWNALAGPSLHNFQNNNIGGGSHTFNIQGSASRNSMIRANVSNLIGGNNTSLRSPNDSNDSGSLYNSLIFGSNLIVTSSHLDSTGSLGVQLSNPSSTIMLGSYNEGGLLADTTQTKFALGTGTAAANRRTSLYVSSSGQFHVRSGMVQSGSLELVSNSTSGSMNLTGSLNVTGTLQVRGGGLVVSGGQAQFNNEIVFNGGTFFSQPMETFVKLNAASVNTLNIDNFNLNTPASQSLWSSTVDTGSNYSQQRIEVTNGGTTGFLNLRNTGGVTTYTIDVEKTVVTGSIQGNVNGLSISSNTASLNLDNGNFFTLQLVEGTDTRIEPSNIKPGQTINLKLNTTGSATVSFPSSVKQPSGSQYVPTTTTGVDIVTLVSFDSSDLYLANVKNLI